MQKASNLESCVARFLVALALACPTVAKAQDGGGGGETAKPVALRIGVPNKHSEREVVFPLIVETSGAASVGRIRAELQLSALDGWSFRGVELTRGLDLRSSVRKRNEGSGKLIVEWDLSGEGKELPTGHVALLRVQASKTRVNEKNVAADNPPALIVRKMSWGLAEFEKRKDIAPEIETPSNINGNPDVSCFFFTH